MSDRDDEDVSKRLTESRSLLAAPVLLYLCFFNGATAFGLVGPDEPRYAAIARDMAAGGDWVTPRLHGEPWFEKPILYYWMAAAGYRLLGDSERAARLPSELGALATSLVLAWLALRAYDRGTAVIVLLLFPTTVAAIAFGRAATTDMPFAATLTLAMATAYPLLMSDPGPRRRLWQAAFGAALGLAVLAKGPAGIILSGGGVALWVLATRQWRRSFALAHPVALASFGIVALPWYVLCALRNPDFVQVFLISHNFERYLTPVFQHQQPFWYFGGVLILGLAPWTVVALGVARRGANAFKAGRWAASPSFFLACWGAFPVLFFSLSESKLPGYVLPAIPAIVLLMAHALRQAIDENGDATRFLFGGIAAVLLVLAAVLFVPAPILPFVPGLEPASLRGAGALTAIAGAVVAYLTVRRLPRAALIAATLGMGIFVWQINAVLMPSLDPVISARPAARRVAALGREHDASVFRLDRAWHFGLNYYLHREVPEWSPDTSPGPIVVTSDAGVEELEAAGLRVTIRERLFEEAVIVTITDPLRVGAPEPVAARFRHRDSR